MTTEKHATADDSSRLSLAGRLMPTIMRLRRSNKNHRSRDHVRRHIERLTANPASTSAPRRPRKGVSISSDYEGGWHVHTIAPTQGESQGTVVYLHGGGWIDEAAPAHWNLVQRIAAEASVTVIFPAYPLVHIGGSAETVVPALTRICERIDGSVVLMGDSAGGTIALSASLLLAERGHPVDLTLLIAPALDMRMQNPEIDEVQPLDPWLVKNGQLLLTELWIGDHGEDPILNPFLGDVGSVGRLVVFSGTRDLLNPDTRLFVQRATEEGADIEYHEQHGHLHVYPLLPTPEGGKARRNIVSAVRHAVAANQG